MAKLCCSVEMEPKTLKPGQINHAREVAVGIVQKAEQVEVSNVVMIQEGEGSVISMEMEQINVEGTTSSQQCGCCINTAAIDEHGGGGQLREPLSAPF